MKTTTTPSRTIVPLILPLLIGCLTTTLSAQQSPRPDEQRVVRLTLTPTPTTRPALNHPLLPSALDQTPGDAASMYLLATIPIKESPLDNEFIEAWLKKPRQPNDNELFHHLNSRGHTYALDHAAIGARREYCNWDVTLKTEGFRARLPHLAPLRDIAYLNAARARAYVANRDHAAAIRDLQTNFALARHLNEESTLVQGLVSTRMIHFSADALEELVQSPGSPNLFWSLVQLPRPFMDLGRVLDSERFALQFSFPPLRNPDALTRAQFHEMLASLGHFYDDPSDKLELTLGLIQAYPRAKDHLVSSRGRPREQVEAMPAHQVLAHYLIDLHVELCDEGGKWYPLPYWQSRQALLDLDEQHKRSADDQGLRFVTAFIPALHRARLQFASADRRLAALQCVETLRAYAAANKGRLPSSLADVKDVPIPVDPLTGEPFAYRLENNIAILDCPAAPGEAKKTGFKYEITIAR